MKKSANVQWSSWIVTNLKL